MSKAPQASPTKISDECVVNYFGTEEEAIRHAVAWTKADGCDRTIVHGPSSVGLVFYVVRGDGGIIHNTERLVGHWRRGKRLED